MPAPRPCLEPRYSEVKGRDGSYWWTASNGHEYAATLHSDGVMRVSVTYPDGKWETVAEVLEHYADVEAIAREIEDELRAAAEEQSEMEDAA